MAMSWGIMGLCTTGLPLLITVGLVVYLFVWLNEKRHRDEFVLSLLAEIHQLAADVRDLTDTFTARPPR